MVSDRMRGVKITSADAMQRAARRLASLLRPGDVIGLVGDLGAGKTVFVKGLADGLGIDPIHVASPTFTLINEYRGGKLVLHHVDLYRLERAEELVELGLEEIVAGEGVCAIEWVDRFAGVAGDDWLEVRIAFAPRDARSLEVVPHGARAQVLAAEWDKRRH
jgi:tRNA threonylcarbamoyladenosine biosynthesis protein TsaE